MLNRSLTSLIAGLFSLGVNHAFYVFQREVYLILVLAGCAGVVCGIVGLFEPGIYDQQSGAPLKVKIWTAISIVVSLGSFVAVYFGCYGAELPF
ncbi:MAG: hypothetical protein AAF456_25700, partial [Planctomycetota bacterium]